MKTLPKIVAIGGPTGTGKTALSLAIAKEFNGEIVNADSRQVYKKLNIGTAKEPLEKINRDGSVVINGIIHHLIDSVEPDEPYSLAHFQADAYTAISTVLHRKSLPVIVGGTGLYLDSVVYNYQLRKHDIDQHKRDRYNHMTTDQLQKLLYKSFPEAFSTMTESDKQNPRRLIRAIEKASKHEHRKGPKRYDTCYLAVKVPLATIERNITLRTTAMFKQGLVDENEALRNAGYTTDLPALKTIGYQEFNNFFTENQTLEETKALINLHTRQYAKRQLTWFARNSDIMWVSDTKEALERVRMFLG